MPEYAIGKSVIAIKTSPLINFQKTTILEIITIEYK